MFLKRIATGTALTASLVVATAGPALAHSCYNTQKAAGSGGTVGTYYVATDEFVPSNARGNLTFVEIVFRDGSSGFLFLHNAKNNDGVVPGAKDCDGKGLDNFEECMAH